jgi:hypothetical protein
MILNFFLFLKNDQRLGQLGGFVQARHVKKDQAPPLRRC